MAQSDPVKPLPLEALYRRCPPEALEFATTDQLDPLSLTWGQERAMRALDLGSRMDNGGFNLYVQASPGTRALEQVRAFLRERASTEPVPDDWCYLYNFTDPDCPIAVQLPPGKGQVLRADLEMLIDELSTSVPAVFESEEYQGKLNELQEAFNAGQQQRLDVIGKEAADQGIALISTPTGFNLAPMQDGQVIEPETYKKLPEGERKAIEEKVVKLQSRLQQVIQDVPKLRKDAQQQVRQLNEEMLHFALGGPVEELRDRWRDQQPVLEHLDRITADVIENAQAFRNEQGVVLPIDVLRRYQANVLVDRGEDEGAPVVYEDLPNHNHLVGVIEQQIRDGAMVTDFQMIRAGSLHRANGGYLIIDARRILSHSLAWES
ncbi:MAG: ATP-binding protein, partial [Pseudomonadota bacterium]